MSKRLCDLFLASLGLLLIWPIFLVLAVLIRLDSPGPIFFRQERIGKDGRPFRIFKFRTMVDDAYFVGPRLTRKRDPRITRLGQVLRWLKLDEFPQLLNVLKGDMSLVGPRPEDPYFVRFYTPEQRAVLSVRPGIVGPSQILGRDELEKYPEGVADTERYYVEHILPEKLSTDLDYVRSCGFFGDLRLIAAGLAATLFGAFSKQFFRLNRKRITLLGIDTLASLMVYHLAYGVKLEWDYSLEALPYFAVVSLLIVLIRPPLFVYFGLYQNILRYLGTREFLTIFKAVTVGSVGISAITFLLGFRAHSRSVFLIDWVLLIMVLFGSRVALKTWREYRRRGPSQEWKSVLIVGADDTAAQLVSAMGVHEALPYQPVGFLDDDPAKHGTAIHGIRVLGSLQDLPQITAVTPVDLVLVLSDHPSEASLRGLVEYCQAHHLDYRMLPTLNQLLTGRVSIQGFDKLESVEVARGTADSSDNGQSSATGEGGGDGKGRPMEVRRTRQSGEACILVTGGAGYIGSHVVRKLLARGCRVRVLDNYLYGAHGLRDLFGHPRIEVIEGDIRDLRKVVLATKGADAVIALAALVGDAACELDADETLSTNLEATQLLADVCQRSGVRRLVFASSCSVYGANSELTLNEGSWLNPVSLYAKTRARSEDILLRRTDQLSVTILRLATVFGLSSRMRVDLLVNTLTASAFFAKEIRVFGGQQFRPNVHVQDAADAFILAAEADDEKVRGEVFNVGDNALNYTVLEIARFVEKELSAVEVEITDSVSDQRDYRVSFDKIRHVLGFRTRFTVEDGIREMVRAFRDREIVTPGEERYHNFRYLKAHGFQGATGVGGGGKAIALKT